MLISRLKNEPAVVIGAFAGAIVAAVQVLAGSDLIGASVVDFISKALNPEGGWAIPIIVGIVTRFFVYGPATAATLRDSLPPGYNP